MKKEYMTPSAEYIEFYSEETMSSEFEGSNVNFGVFEGGEDSSDWGE